MNVPCARCGALTDPRNDCMRCLMKLVLEKADSASEEALTQIPRLRELEILEVLGRGGMGRVYKARHISLNRTVAVKILPPEVSMAPHFNARFEREARILAGLNHPNIVAVHDYGTEDEQSYLVMEFIEGVNLRDLMREKLTADQALSIARQVCDALEYSHAHGVVHRDVKPENILVDRDSRVRIVDFGLARVVTDLDRRLTSPHQVMGTLHYMAPEQYEGLREADQRADIYSLGVVLYEMLTGELPVGKFPLPSHQNGALDVRLDDIVLRALEKRPSRRYQRVTDVKTDLALSDTEQRQPGRRSFLRWIIVLVLVLLALTLSVVLLPSHPPDPRDEVVGVWKGTWTSSKDTRDTGGLETEISKSPSNPGCVRLALTLRRKGVLVGEGEFEVRTEARHTLLSARRLVVGGQIVEGLWRFTTIRSGKHIEGQYEITVAGTSDSGLFEQEIQEKR